MAFRMKGDAGMRRFLPSRRSQEESRVGIVRRQSNAIFQVHDPSTWKIMKEKYRAGNGKWGKDPVGNGKQKRWRKCGGTKEENTLVVAIT